MNGDPVAGMQLNNERLDHARWSASGGDELLNQEGSRSREFLLLTWWSMRR